MIKEERERERGKTTNSCNATHRIILFTELITTFTARHLIVNYRPISLIYVCFFQSYKIVRQFELKLAARKAKGLN